MGSDTTSQQLDCLSEGAEVMPNPADFAEYDKEAVGDEGVMSSPSTHEMDGDDSDEDDMEIIARQTAANEL
eukprot:769878-Heterocapsa_arctica.AAC.1